MERNEITIAILVSTFALIFIALHLAPSNTTPTDPIDEINSTSKCWSPPGIEFSKGFFWEIECWNAYPDTYYEPLVAEWIFVEFYSYACGTGHWIPVGWFATNCTGYIDLCGPPGCYRFTWVKADGSREMTCMEWYDTEPIYCCQDVYTNYLTPKGGDKAFLFFDPSKNIIIPSQTFLGDVHQ